jgi:juvenile hormone diol kinase
MPPLRGVWRDTSWSSLLSIFSFVWALVALFPAMIAYAWWETMRSEPFRAALLGGLGLWALLLPPTFFLLRGRSTALRDLLMTTISNLWGLPCLVLVVGLFLNGAFLDDAVERRPVIVERTWISRGKSTSYHARLSSREPGAKPIEIRVERRVHANARPSQPATLVYRTGRLGWEILETIELGRLQRQANPSRSRTSMTQPGGMSPFLVRKHTYSFMLFDTDGDGLVERADHDRIVDAACKARRLSGADAERFHAGMAQIWETLEKMVDRDGDHKINLDEWLAFQGGLASNREAWQMAIEGNIRQFLALFDVDGDGALNPTEYAHMLGAYGLPGAVARLNFARLDLNGDGVISTDELVELVREWSFGEDPAAPGAFLFGPLPG